MSRDDSVFVEKPSNDKIWKVICMANNQRNIHTVVLLMQMEQKPCGTDMNSQLQHKYYISFKAELHTNMTHTGLSNPNTDAILLLFPVKLKSSTLNAMYILYV